MDGYSLSRQWFDFAFENPEKINSEHTAIYFLACEQWNRFGQKEKFGFPSYFCMEVCNIKSHKTYKKYFDDLVEWGFFKIIQESKNQYSSCIIAMVENDKALSKALDKANAKHTTKHLQDSDTIDKQLNNETIKQGNISSLEDTTALVVSDKRDGSIDSLIELIKITLEPLGLIYKAGKQERNRAKNILTAKEFGETCERSGMTREKFVTEIIRLSAKLDFWNGKIYNCETFYDHYPKVYNEARRIKESKKESKISSVTF